jgi:hypothetical protein
MNADEDQPDPNPHPLVKSHSHSSIDSNNQSNTAHQKNSTSSPSSTPVNHMLSPQGVVKKGILSKRGRKMLFRPWVLRTVILDDQNNLSYYDGNTLKGIVNLEGTTTTIVPTDKADGRKFAFEITNIAQVGPLQTHSLLLAAGSQAEAEEWVDVISTTMRKNHFSSKKTAFQYESFDVSIPYCLFSHIMLIFLTRNCAILLLEFI